MKMVNEGEIGAGFSFGVQIPDGYDSRKFRKELQDAVTALGSEGLPLNDTGTYDEAANIVAGRYRITKGELSWRAHRADLMKERGKQFMEYWAKLTEADKRPALPGLEEFVILPRAVLLGDEEVALGDPRLTLAVFIEQSKLAADIKEKEAKAYAFKSKESEEERDQYLKRHAEYLRIAEINEYHLGASELVYDTKAKGFVPRKGAKGRP